MKRGAGFGLALTGNGARWWWGQSGGWALSVSGTDVVVSRQGRAAPRDLRRKDLQGLRGKWASLGVIVSNRSACYNHDNIQTV